MSATYRFSLLRSSGWIRLGVAGSLAALLGTPMLWALGVFGFGEEGLHRALIFLVPALWFPLVITAAVSWALRGFAVRVRDPEEEEEEHRQAGAGRPAFAPPSPARSAAPRPARRE